MNANLTCGSCGAAICPIEFSFCHDMADISGYCDTIQCQAAAEVSQSAASGIVVLTVSSVLDMSNVIAKISFRRFFEARILSSGVSSLFKWIGLSILLMSETTSFSGLLFQNNCLSPSGQAQLASGIDSLYAALVFCAVSAFLSLASLPFVIFDKYEKLNLQSESIFNY